MLKVISRSTFDLQAVLDTLIELAARLCEADMACIVRPRGSYFQFAANYRIPQIFVDLVTTTPISAGRGTLAGRVLAEGHTVHLPDVLVDPEYSFSEALKLVRLRSGLGVPLMREGTPIGVIILWRSQTRPFTDKQIEMVTTFADQAVIAIENVRLFDEVEARTREVQELLEYQTAISEVLNGCCDGERGYDCEDYMSTAGIIGEGCWRDGLNSCVKIRYPGRGSLPAASPRASHRAHHRCHGRRRIHDESGHAPALIPFSASPCCAKASRLASSSWRSRRPFTDKQIELVTTFADQALIAIENVRLFEAEQARTASYRVA